MESHSTDPQRNAVAESPLLTLISALLFLYVGFGLGLVGISGDPLYDGSVAALTWGARIVGIGLLVAAALIFARLPGANLLDLILATIAAAGCLMIGAIWMVKGDNQGFLLLIFGLLNGSAARGAWLRWRGTLDQRDSSVGPPEVQ